MREITDIAVQFVADHEGFRGVAYQDSAGVWTAGWGHIEGVTSKTRVTRVKALEWLKEDMVEAQRKLYAALKADVIDCLTEHQWAALLSFAFNVGFKSTWGIAKRLNAKAWDQVPGEMLRFVNAGGKKVQGLVNRRTDEIKLWSTEEPGSTTETVSSATTRSIDTPPTPVSPTPPQKSPTIIAGAVSAVAAVPAAVDQVTKVVAPYADKSETVQKIIATLATVGAIAAVLVVIFAWLKKKRERS